MTPEQLERLNALARDFQRVELREDDYCSDDLIDLGRKMVSVILPEGETNATAG